MITKQILFIQIATLLISYFSVAVNSKKFNIDKWEQDESISFFITLLMIHVSLFIYTCIFS